jgi:hypothetical protein
MIIHQLRMLSKTITSHLHGDSVYMWANEMIAGGIVTEADGGWHIYLLLGQIIFVDCELRFSGAELQSVKTLVT